ncbi:MAG: ABC transporter permease, partial [Bacteroidales bacterium]|nr:ABC transporter permease [Bacteroidales bacterium]
RPTPDYSDYKFIKERSETSQAVALMLQYERSVKFGRNSISNCTIRGVTQDWEKVSNIKLESGRYFVENEVNNGVPVCVVGYRVWEELFEGINPLGKKIKIGGRDLTVIGVFEKEGESMANIGGGTDATILMPLNMCHYIVDMRRAGATILAKPKVGVSAQDFEDELLVLMRSCRRLAPGQKNNFSLNRMTMLVKMVDGVFSMINTVGWVIAGFSLLIGGFGIANIMFVSVKERTNMIGIQKALGAKKYVILTQFLTESVFLAIAGGVVGIILLFVVVLLIPEGGMLVMKLTPGNIVSGLLIASIIGIVSGMAPAISAANLDPVVAINSK